MANLSCCSENIDEPSSLLSVANEVVVIAVANGSKRDAFELWFYKKIQ